MESGHGAVPAEGRGHQLGLYPRLLLLLLVAGCASSPARLVEREKVVTSIYPLADLAERVAGGRMEVVSLLPSGASPHTFEFTPSLVRKLARARVFVKVGLGFESWADKALEAAGRSDLVILQAADGVRPIRLAEQGKGEKGGFDPHVWLDPEAGRILATRLGEALATVDPAGARDYRARAKALAGEIAAFEREMEETCRGIAARDFVALHSAWVYFARRCGLRQVAALEPSPGKEAYPRQMAALAVWLRRSGARAVFSEARVNPLLARTLAEEAGVELVVLDPLGGPGLAGRDSYIGLLRFNLFSFARALDRKALRVVGSKVSS